MLPFLDITKHVYLQVKCKIWFTRMMVKNQKATLRLKTITITSSSSTSDIRSSKSSSSNLQPHYNNLFVHMVRGTKYEQIHIQKY